MDTGIYQRVIFEELLRTLVVFDISVEFDEATFKILEMCIEVVPHRFSIEKVHHRIMVVVQDGIRENYLVEDSSFLQNDNELRVEIF